MRVARLLLVAVAATTACIDTSGPATPADLSGTWSYNAFELVGDGMSCSMYNVRLVFAQSGAAPSTRTFSGTTGAGRMSCSGTKAPSGDVDVPANVIRSGTIDGNAVTFDIGTPDIHHTGTWSPGSKIIFPNGAITGQVTMRVTVGGTTVNLAGKFGAAKE